MVQCGAWWRKHDVTSLTTVWCGMVWYGVVSLVWCGVAWCGVTWCDLVFWLGSVEVCCVVLAWCCLAWCWCSVVRCGVVLVLVWCDVVQYVMWWGVVGRGVVWCGVVWCGVVCAVRFRWNLKSRDYDTCRPISWSEFRATGHLTRWPVSGSGHRSSF